jgi:hypothetical protein
MQDQVLLGMNDNFCKSVTFFAVGKSCMNCMMLDTAAPLNLYMDCESSPTTVRLRFPISGGHKS